MTGWLILLVLLAVTGGALWLLGVRGGMLQLAGAALLFGAAGYAWQGRPGLAGQSRTAMDKAPPIPLTRFRQAFDGNFSPNQHWHVMAAASSARGNTADAVGIMRSAVGEHPRDPSLWVGLGNALVDHSGVLTPPAQLAFERAAGLAPSYPAPRFFYGLALARSGNGAAAVAIWRQLLADSPAEASWRPLVEDAILAIDRPQAGS
ncbi:MAG TPA: cytochrome C biosynthesis protein [Sphingomicrobium sp.]|nr:cytochrome C biosynthesis protein [Sphingomicrobium sp.]